ncbi:Thioredoxin [Penicillium concentricum]|uniref:Thioredoxin n=1 Tax=Penicillium concentricum TaxID=293559 RepID=A0A9W9SW21_9EURO|nr:Thioredoxin [Penicillium concentricum]KAJ5384824.1 Thioredoxin [Penicillium concentricum]
MSVVEISSKEQFSSLLTSSRLVVADFYADWCGPCKAIAPAYNSLATQLSRPNHITFTKINVDHQQELAKAYGVTAMPTFIVFKNGRVNQTVKGANPTQLNQIVQKLASEASQSDDAAGSGEGSSSGELWLGGTVAKGYSDITDQVDVKGLELLNRDTDTAEPRALFNTSKPSGLAAKGKGKAAGQADWTESDTDEQLMLYIPFNSTLKVHSLQITSLPPADADADDDETPMRPRNLHIYKNTSHVLGFDEADGIPPVQKVEIQSGDWDAKTGTATVALRFVNFQNVTSLVVFFVDGDGDSEKLRVDRIRVIGEAGANRSMGKLEKIGDEPGE